MFLQKLSIVNFKNYSELDIEFSQKLNCFTGNNGVGKTNLLDAIYYLSMCKSYFNSIDSQNVHYGDDFFMIQGNYLKNDHPEIIHCGFKRTKKKVIKRNKKEYERFSDHIGLLPIVMVSPNDSSLITEGSEDRRKYMDSVISQFDKSYLEDLLKYNRALEQRNKLLKDFKASGSFDKSFIEVFDDQLAHYGQRIYGKRISFIEQLMPIFQAYYNFVAQGKEKVLLTYESQLHTIPFKELLETNLEKDRYLEYTSVGIHKDDLLLKLSGMPIKRTGSQGQQKTFLVALKLAQFDFVKSLSGNSPIILLDDIFDKLDANRVKQIIELVAGDKFGQIFITDTSGERLQKIFLSSNFEYKIFDISANDQLEVKLI